jgi:N-methylhydantoinase B
VAGGAVTGEAAERVYGVVPGDADATAQLRERRLLERLAAAGAARDSLAPERTVPDRAQTVADVYVINRDDDRIECHRCGTRLGAVTDDPKQGMALVERPLESLAPGAPDPSVFVDDEVVWRDLLCPGCGVRLATEVAYPGSPPYREIELF